MMSPLQGNDPGGGLFKLLLDAIRGRNEEPMLPAVQARPPAFGLTNTADLGSKPWSEWTPQEKNDWAALESTIDTPFAKDTLSQLFIGPHNLIPIQYKPGSRVGGFVNAYTPRDVHLATHVTRDESDRLVFHELVHSSEFLGDGSIPTKVQDAIWEAYRERGHAADFVSNSDEIVARAFESALKYVRNQEPLSYLEYTDVERPGTKVAYDFLKSKIKDTSKQDER